MESLEDQQESLEDKQNSFEDDILSLEVSVLASLRINIIIDRAVRL